MTRKFIGLCHLWINAMRLAIGE